ncbi:MAG: hypothetical protein AAGI34_13775 [Pseudomonadota bacterium]
MVDRASTALAEARTSAEVLDARDLASVAYDAAKKAARLQKAKGAHDELIAAAHRAQADALEIEATAKRRLADEYDAAQERGEVRGAGNPNCSGSEQLPGPSDLGLTRKQVHDARQVRDAERTQPGLVRGTLDRALDEGREPTRAELQRSVIEAVKDARTPAKRDRNPHHKPDPMWDRVTAAASLFDDVASLQDLDRLARWDGNDWSAARLRQKARAAQATLTDLLTLCEAHDAQG